MSIFNMFNKKEDPDELIISHLVKANSNLTKPHKIDFFLYFPTMTLADEAKIMIQNQYSAFEILNKESAQGGNILCEVHGTLAPDVTALKDIRIKFNEIATKLQGQYDGWGTEIEE